MSKEKKLVVASRDRSVFHEHINPMFHVLCTVTFCRNLFVCSLYRLEYVMPCGYTLYKKFMELNRTLKVLILYSVHAAILNAYYSMIMPVKHEQ